MPRTGSTPRGHAIIVHYPGVCDPFPQMKLGETRRCTRQGTAEVLFSWVLEEHKPRSTSPSAHLLTLQPEWRLMGAEQSIVPRAEPDGLQDPNQLLQSPASKQSAPPLAVDHAHYPAPSRSGLGLLLPTPVREPPRGEAPAAQSCGLRMAWRNRSHPHPSPGCSRRCCREAERLSLQSPEPGNTRDMRPRRSGTAPACCRPATSRRGDAQGKARGRIRGGRQRRARQHRETE